MFTKAVQLGMGQWTIIQQQNKVLCSLQKMLLLLLVLYILGVTGNKLPYREKINTYQLATKGTSTR